MTALPKLTRLEMDVLAGCYASDYTDGMEWFAIWSWSMKPMVTTEKQRSGVVASLVKKGIVTCGGSGSKDDDNTIDVTDLGIKVARSLGIYNDETGYDKDVHADLVGYNVGPANTNEDVAGGDKVMSVIPVVTDVVSVKLGYGIMQVMQLDDEGVCREWGLVIDARKKSFIIVWATRKDLINFSNACADRISSQYDQPLWYMSSAKATVAKIAAALKGK